MTIGRDKFKDSNKTDFATYDTVAELVAAPASRFSDGAEILLRGYYAAGDFGEAVSLIVESAAAGVNSFTLTDGRFTNLYADVARPEWFGARGDNSTNDTTALQTAINSGKLVLGSKGKTYRANQLNIAANGTVINLGGSTLKAAATMTQNTPALNITADDVEIFGGTIDGSAELFDETMSFFVSTARIEITGKRCSLHDCLITNQYFNMVQVTGNAERIAIYNNRFLGTANTLGAANVYAAGVQPTVGGAMGARGGAGDAIYADGLTVTYSGIVNTQGAALRIENNEFEWNRGIKVIGVGDAMPEVVINGNILRKRAGVLSGGVRMILTNNIIDPERIPQFRENVFSDLCQCISGEVFSGSVVSGNICKNFTDFGVELSSRDKDFVTGYDNPERSGLTVTGNMIDCGETFLPTTGVSPRGLYLSESIPHNGNYLKTHRVATTVTGNTFVGCRAQVLIDFDSGITSDLQTGNLYEITTFSGGDFSSQSNVTGNGAVGDVFEYNGSAVTFGASEVRSLPNFVNGQICGENVLIADNVFKANTNAIVTPFSIGVEGYRRLKIANNIFDAGETSLVVSAISTANSRYIHINNNQATGYVNLINQPQMPLSFGGLDSNYWNGWYFAENNTIEINVEALNVGVYQPQSTEEDLLIGIVSADNNTIKQKTTALGALLGYKGQPTRRIDFSGWDDYATGTGAAVQKGGQALLTGGATTDSKAQLVTDMGSAVLRHRRAEPATRHQTWQIGPLFSLSFNIDVKNLYATAFRQDARIVFGKIPEDTTSKVFLEPYNYQTSGTIVSGRQYLVSAFVAGDDFNNVASVNQKNCVFTATGTAPTNYTFGSTLSNQTDGGTQTSGALIVGKVYKVITYVSGDDFNNVRNINVNNSVFTATGTTPTTYTNGSTLIECTMCFGMSFTKTSNVFYPTLFFFSGTQLFEAVSTTSITISTNGSGYIWNCEILSCGRSGSPCLHLLINGNIAATLSNLGELAGLSSGTIFDETPFNISNGIHLELARGLSGSANPSVSYSDLTLKEIW